MNILELRKSHQRLSMLRALVDSPDMGLNDSILQDVLVTFNVGASRAEVHEELRWLAEQELVRLDSVGSSVVAVITERGIRVAEGKAIVRGIKMPSVADMDQDARNG